MYEYNEYVKNDNNYYTIHAVGIVNLHISWITIVSLHISKIFKLE